MASGQFFSRKTFNFGHKLIFWQFNLQCIHKISWILSASTRTTSWSTKNNVSKPEKTAQVSSTQRSNNTFFNIKFHHALQKKKRMNNKMQINGHRVRRHSWRKNKQNIYSSMLIIICLYTKWAPEKRATK